MRGLGLWLVGVLWPQAITLGSSLPHVEQYEVIWPQRLPGSRARRALLSPGGLYPESVSYILGAEGRTFTLNLRKNRALLGSAYTETYLATNGSEVTEQLPSQDHCLYQGHVEGHQDSAASFSICSGLRGFFKVSSAVHLIEPLDGDKEEGPHAVYRAEHLKQQTRATCGVSETSLDNRLGTRVLAAFRSHYRSQLLSQETRYVEMYVVTDSMEFQKFRTKEAVRSRVLEVVNHVDKLYQELNFRVVLVGLEIWSRDKFHVSPYANITLDNFLSWRQRALLGRHHHDNVQFITGIDFIGTTVGLAKVSAICSRDSGAVNQDHSHNPIGVASTIAHELGHNLGMNHDENIPGCYCPVSKENGGCIMAGSLSSQFPKMFSHCSRTDLQEQVEMTHSICLANAPDLNMLVGGPVCGNLFVERGEQCDCGSPQDCRNPCCNATTCQLAEGADCAYGGCCHNCKVKPAGETCRVQRDECDLEEFCDGRHPTCPKDAFQENGTPCPGGYCFNGNCPSMDRRCQELWGPRAQAAVDTCFTHSIPPGCQGRVFSSRGIINNCGTLYCMGGLLPRERTSCTFPSHGVSCQALAMDSSVTPYEPVPEGTKCGEGKVCWKGFCQELSIYGERNCSAQCHNHGVCNHKKECHCHLGWAPPYCAERLTDAQTVTPRSFLVKGLVGLVLLAAVVILAAVIIHHKLRRRGIVPETTGLSNPLFYGRNSGMPAKDRIQGPTGLASVCSRQSPKPPVVPKRPSPAPPAAMSSPAVTIPVYPQQAPEQLRLPPPTMPLPKLKPKQAKLASVPPVPPVKPKAGGPIPGVTQVADGPKVALKPPVQRR
ncbi:disintegrin and metalloproteinase domain-containing protein 8 [Perognathus longimembris pacificus]|uniref:disintegrin and metalloproteinase domain-containing protein 8 n=1 Tax=Perognathus longimembris pacificus TaxID=214514 RepID=UPI002019F546|nr:disintegrin and metalloproteinase domain-containing protein 8 [Perognathus longimembris pacificus]